MAVQIYAFQTRTGTIRRAVLVTTVEVDAFPNDQLAFAAEHGGDFIEVDPVEFATT